MEQSTLNFIYFLAVIGALVFVFLLAKLLWSLIKLILPQKNYVQRYGANTWAVVTGGSDGIGLGFCQQLGKLGFNICMVARNKQKMQSALQTIRHQNQNLNLQTKLIVADFADCQKPDFFVYISRQLEGMDVSILVNNVGISNIGFFHQIPDTRIMNQVNINVVAMTMMSHHLIQKMLKRQHRSAIINLASFAAQHPIPYISTYSATKAYNDYFSKSIQMEYSYKIDVLSLRPLYVESNLSKKKKSLMVASRTECARAGLGHLGIDYQTNGYIMHRIIAALTNSLPNIIIRCLSQSSSRQIMEEQKQKLMLAT